MGRHAGVELSMQETRRFQMEELSLATKNFSNTNLIGEGKFGEVYMGFLQDGMLVAIKRRPGTPSQEFINEVIITVLHLQVKEKVLIKCLKWIYKFWWQILNKFLFWNVFCLPYQLFSPDEFDGLVML